LGARPHAARRRADPGRLLLMKIVSPADAKAELSTYVRKYDDVS